MNNRYNASQKRWDKYGAFYSLENNFVSFETGETMFIRHNPSPSDRYFYSSYNVHIVGTHEPEGIKFLHPVTGKLVPAAQLSIHGMQQLLVDCNTKKVVSIGAQNAKNYRTPSHMNTAKVWTYGNNQEIFSDAYVLVAAPFVYTKEAKEWIKIAVTTAKLMKTNDDWYNRSVEIEASMLDKYTPSEYIINKAENDKILVNRIARNGFKIVRTKEQLSHLMVA